METMEVKNTSEVIIDFNPDSRRSDDLCDEIETVAIAFAIIVGCTILDLLICRGRSKHRHTSKVVTKETRDKKSD